MLASFSEFFFFHWSGFHRQLWNRAAYLGSIDALAHIAQVGHDEGHKVSAHGYTLFKLIQQKTIFLGSRLDL